MKYIYFLLFYDRLIVENKFNNSKQLLKHCRTLLFLDIYKIFIRLPALRISKISKYDVICIFSASFKTLSVA